MGGGVKGWSNHLLLRSSKATIYSPYFSTNIDMDFGFVCFFSRQILADRSTSQFLGKMIISWHCPPPPQLDYYLKKKHLFQYLQFFDSVSFIWLYCYFMLGRRRRPEKTRKLCSQRIGTREVFKARCAHESDLWGSKRILHYNYISSETLSVVH